MKNNYFRPGVVPCSIAARGEKMDMMIAYCGLACGAFFVSGDTLNENLASAVALIFGA